MRVGSRETDASRTEQVYQWCLKDPQWRIPLKGTSEPFEQHIRWRDVVYQDPGKKRDPITVRLHQVDPIYWRDLLSGFVAAKYNVVDADGVVTGDLADQWLLNDVDDEEYNRHLSAVHKTRKRKGRGTVETWEPRPGFPRHDYHDLESYQLAMAHGPAHCDALPSPEQLARQHEASRNAASPVSGGFRAPDGRSFLASRR